MGMSDLIANFINEMLEEEDGTAELQRQSLAHKFNCVPSQINYVISTRFSPEHGCRVESRRGGGGYIRISRVQQSPNILLMHMVNAIGGSLDEKTARAFIGNALDAGAVDRQSARLMLAAVGAQALKDAPADKRGAIRASILKQMLLKLM